jgi:DNA-binding MarR family transcriptional regulator
VSDPISARRGYFLLQVAASRTRTIADDLFAAAGGVSTAQAAVLSFVVAHPGCSQRDVATALRQRESAVTAMVRRLVETGLVERRARSTDLRSWELWATPAGLTSLDHTRPALETLNRQLEAAVGPERIHTFLDCLESLVALGAQQEADP